MSKKLFLPPMVANPVPKFTLTDTFKRAEEMTRRMSEMRTHVEDLTDRAGFTPAAVESLQDMTAEVRILGMRCKSVAAKLQELSFLTTDACNVIRKADAELTKSNDETRECVRQTSVDTLNWLVGNEPRVVALLRNLGPKLPPTLAQAIEMASDRVPDTQALQDAYSQLGNTVSRDEGDRLERVVKDLEQEREALKAHVQELEKQLIEQKDETCKGDADRQLTQLNRIMANEAATQEQLDGSNAEATELCGVINAIRRENRQLAADKRASSNSQDSLQERLRREEQRVRHLLRQLNDLEKSFDEAKAQEKKACVEVQSTNKDLGEALEEVDELQRQWDGFMHLFLGSTEPKWDEAVVRGLWSGGAMVQSQASWRRPWILLRSWSKCSRELEYGRDISAITLAVLVHYGQGSWGDQRGAFDTLRGLQAALGDPDVSELSSSVVGFLFAVMAHVVEYRNSTVMVGIAAWQIMWLLADRWPQPSYQSFLSKASDGIRILCRDRHPESLPEDFAAHAKIGGSYFVKPAECDGVIVVGQTTMFWVDLMCIKIGLGKLTLSPPEGIEGPSTVLLLDEPDVEWVVANLM